MLATVGTDPGRVPSLDVVERQLPRVHDEQLRHLEALDAKASVLLGFAGAIAALAPSSTGLLPFAGRVLSLASGILSLSALWPRASLRIDVRELRDSYVQSEVTFSRLTFLDTNVRIAESDDRALLRKSRRIRLAGSLLVLGVIGVAIGAGLH